MSQPTDSPAGTLQPAELRAVSDAIRREQPLGDPGPGLVLMDVDPHRLHAYWQLDPAVLARARADFDRAGGAHLVLRFREVEQPEYSGLPALTTPLESFDREIEGAHGQVEVGLWGRGGTWEAELGLTARDGGWLPLARSGLVHMAPAGPAVASRFTRVAPGGLVRVALPRGGEAQGPQPVRVDLPEPLGSRRAVEAVGGEGGEPTGVAVDLAPVDPSLRGGDPDDLEPEFPIVTLAGESARGAAVAPVRVSGVDLDGQVPAGERPEQSVAPRVPAAAARDEAPDQPPRHAAGSAWSGTADLELHAELFVYGRAHPGYELVLFGRRIQLEPDGSFQLRIPLSADEALLGALARRDDDYADGTH